MKNNNNIEDNMSPLIFSTVHVDSLPSFGVRPSEGTVMADVGYHVYTRMELEWLAHFF